MVDGYMKNGVSGEDSSFDMETETWTALDKKAETIKKEWGGNKVRNDIFKNEIKTAWTRWLKMCLSYGKSYLDRKGKVL